MPETGKVRAQGSTKLAIQEFFASERRNAERIQKHTLGLTDDDELPPYVHQDYPKAMFALDGDSITVQDRHEESERAAEGFYSSLAEMKAAQAAEEEQAKDSEVESHHETPKRGSGGRFLKKEK